jgi:hypothetical protein
VISHLKDIVDIVVVNTVLAISPHDAPVTVFCPIKYHGAVTSSKAEAQGRIHHRQHQWQHYPGCIIGPGETSLSFGRIPLASKGTLFSMDCCFLYLDGGWSLPMEYLLVALLRLSAAANAWRF